MNCVIIDDNIIATTTLKHLALQVKGLKVVADFEDSIEAYTFLQKNKVDIILLDIEMPAMSGIELTKMLPAPRPVIIFTTSKREYAVEAFELNIADYVVKPVTLARLMQAIEKARHIINSHKENIEYKDDEFIFFRDSNIVRRIRLDDILFAEAMGDYVKLHTAQKFYAIHNKLKEVEEHLRGDKFVRVHRSYIVAIGKIDAMQDGALIINGTPVPVADGYRATLNKRLNIL